MKKLSTISLFIFAIILAAILTAGLVFYQNNKSGTQNGSKVVNTVAKLTSSGKSLVLNMTEIKKHNNQSDCWMLISGKVYDITSFFGSHPGGNAVMAATCGIDATDAYMTKDPNATSTSGGRDHSSRAKSMLDSYYLGDLNQQVVSPSVTPTPSATTPNVTGGSNFDD